MTDWIEYPKYFSHSENEKTAVVVEVEVDIIFCLTKEGLPQLYITGANISEI